MKLINLFSQKDSFAERNFQLSNLIEILQDAVCITDVSGELIYLNRAGYKMLGLDKLAELSDYNFFSSCMKDEEKIAFIKQQINQTGLVRNFETQVYRFPGGVLDVILTVNNLKDYKQKTIGLLFLFKDITEFKKIQQQLLQTQKLESIGLMASGIAHEFNNILAAIIPNAELIKLSLDESDINAKRAEIIEKSAHRASDIAGRLLTFTRQNDHKFEEYININGIISDSLELLQHSIADNIRISCELEPHLHFIKGDETQIQQIIMNLTINAKDAMSDGGNITIMTTNFEITNYYQIGSLDPGNYVKLLFKDSGTGIALEILPKIFDPFFTTKEIGKGTGLGLSVVYGIVKSLGGHIDVSSKINIGTIFELYFPANPQILPQVEEKNNDDIGSKKFHFLVVDDEDYVLNILGDIIEFLGFTATKRGNGKEAINFFRKNHDKIDYVILDLKMPKMGGKAACAELKKIDPKVKVIFTSGFDDTPESKKNMTDVVGFLKKPYSISQVSKSIKELISK